MTVLYQKQNALRVLGNTEVDRLDGSSAVNPVQVTENLNINGTLTAVDMESDIHDMNSNDVRVANDIDVNRITAADKMTIEGNMIATSNLSTPKLTGSITASAMPW